MATTRFELHVKQKGRTVLPVGFREACGFGTDVTLIARPIGPGQAIIETMDAVLARLWDGIPSRVEGAVEDVAAQRAEERAVLDERAGDADAGDDESDARGARALAILGLD